ETDSTGSCAPHASPCAIPAAIRSPVKEPGPRPNAMASISDSFSPASASRASIIGRISLVCSRGVSRKSSLILPSANSATEQASEEVSSARIRVMGKVRQLRLQDKHVGDGKRETQGPYRAPWANTGGISRVGQRSGREYSQRCPRL